MTFSPKRDRVLLLEQPPDLPPVTELARPELRLGGVRLDAEQRSGSRMSRWTGMLLVGWEESLREGVLLPPGDEEAAARVGARRVGGWEEPPAEEGELGINYPAFNNAGTHLAFTLRNATGEARAPLELWLSDCATGESRRLVGGLNAIIMTRTRGALTP